ncbi:unnamed protein product [Paramecium sonneborni]|uniref:Transmembrane protein n=1 Tax=Paramecium sonneborni TaxID=65129 RepID=A0A8S1QY74_9CILI|nr:unnamed protein product [Paramecium sonneborni]
MKACKMSVIQVKVQKQAGLFFFNTFQIQCFQLLFLFVVIDFIRQIRPYSKKSRNSMKFIYILLLLCFDYQLVLQCNLSFQLLQCRVLKFQFCFQKWELRLNDNCCCFSKTLWIWYQYNQQKPFRIIYEIKTRKKTNKFKLTSNIFRIKLQTVHNFQSLESQIKQNISYKQLSISYLFYFLIDSYLILLKYLVFQKQKLIKNFSGFKQQEGSNYDQYIIVGDSLWKDMMLKQQQNHCHFGLK